MPYTDPAAKKAYDRARYLRLREEADYQAMMSAYRAANKARQRELGAAWYDANREAVSAERKLQYAADPEPIRAAARSYYESKKDDPDFRETQRVRSRQYHQGRGREVQAEWKRRNRHVIARYARMRRARKRTTEIEPIDAAVVYERDGWICQLCGEATEPSGPRARRPTVDHIIPLSRGGPHTYANVQTAHGACNSRKGNALPRVEELAANA